MNPSIPDLEPQAGNLFSSQASPELEWLPLLQRQSQLLMAVLELGAANGPQVVWANHHFCQLAGLAMASAGSGLSLLQRLTPQDQGRLTILYRRHIVNALLKTHYDVEDWIEERLLHEPVVVTLAAANGQVRRVELRLRGTGEAGQGIQIYHLEKALIEVLSGCWSGVPTSSEVMEQLYQEKSPLNQLLDSLVPDSYRAGGYLLLEGTDVTERELTKQLIELLVNGDSVLEPQKFNQANQLIKQLFRASDTLILSAEQNQATLFMDLEQPDWTVTSYGVEELQQSSFFAACEQGQVANIADLAQQGTSRSERQMVEQGVRSLLLIPLVSQSRQPAHPGRCLVGVVGIVSDQPYAFNQADCSNATTLIPALSAAMRHTVRTSLTNIHESVRWRFEQEAERRSWGLSPQPITFEGVFPLYGISDVRGSSEQRNLAIQADLIHQFDLALGVVEQVLEAAPSAFVQQLWHDLQEYCQALRQGITVDAEVTLLHYLQQEVEAHFDYFAHCGQAVAAAIATYQAALNPEQGCVYTARARYDQTIQSINDLLRQTWNQWQQTMQPITPHYCDVEATDGIDHMIYAGRAIDPNFTDFHLHSLRYEQLRAVCACARAAFSLKQLCDSDLEVTHLVLVQATTVDITHDEHTERLFDVRGTRDTRYEIVKKRIDKACDGTGKRITQPGMLTVVYSTEEEWQDYQRYLRYLQRERLVDEPLELGQVESLQGVSGLKFARVAILPAAADAAPG